MLRIYGSRRIETTHLKPDRVRAVRRQGQVALTLAGTDMQSLLRDVRYGLRSLLKAPGLTAVAVLALTLGIGLTTTMFSIVYGAMLKGLPYPDGDRIVTLRRENPARGINGAGISILDFGDYKAQARSFSDLVTIGSGTIFVSGDEKAERFDGAWTSYTALSMTGVNPILGRPFRAGEDTPQGEKVAILSYSMWHDRYAADANIIGRIIRVNGVPTTIVGVMPERFEFPENCKIWIPLQ